MRRKATSQRFIVVLLMLPLLIMAVSSGSRASNSNDVSTSTTVWIFTTQQLPELHRRDLATEVFVLDDIEPSLAALSFRFPGSVLKAREQASRQLNSLAGQRVFSQLKTHGHAIALAKQYGITKLPAVFVDKHYVVYGEYSVDKALQRVEDYRAAR